MSGSPHPALYHDCCITWKWCILYTRHHTPSVITYYRHGYSLSLSQVKHCNYIHTQPSLDPGHWRMVPSTQSSHPEPLLHVILIIIIARAEYCPENRYLSDIWCLENRYLIDIWCFLEDYLRKVQICESEKFYPLIKVIEGQFSARIPFNAQLLVLSLWDIKYVLKMHLLKIYLSNTPPNVVI